MSPLNIAWQHDGKFDDGSNFGPAEYAGTEISVNGQAFASIPVAFAPDGLYGLPISALGLGNGTHVVTLRVVAANGNKSPASAPLSFAIDNRTPTAPFGLTAS
jgi:hypothetical protein